MIPLAPLLLLAALQDPFAEMEAKAEAEARGAAREMLEQMLAEDRSIYHDRESSGGEEVWIDTPPRASDRDGICQIDRLEIQRDSGGAIRKVRTTHHFLVLTGPGDKPLWDFEGEELEKSCAAVGRSERWFTAGEAFDAEAAVVALLGFKEAMLKPDRAPGVWSCAKRKPCPDPKAMAERIEPLDPERVSDGGTAGVPCPEGLYCVSVSLSHTDCDSWVTQLRLDRSKELRFHSARPGWQLHVLHCNEVPMGPEG